MSGYPGHETLRSDPEDEDCYRCGKRPKEGVQLLECRACHDIVCTASCIAGVGVKCFQCEETSAPPARG